MSTIRKGLTSFNCEEAGGIPNGSRVKIGAASNGCLLAGSTDQDIGISTMDMSTAKLNTPVPVRLNAEPGSCFVTTNGAITINSILYKAAAGKVASSGTDVWGVALETAAADGDILEGLITAPSTSTPADGSVTVAKIGTGAVSAVKLADALAGVSDGLGILRVARATFNPTLTAGQRTVGAHDLGVTIPINAVVVGGFLQVETAFDSADHTGSVAFSVQAANDLITASAINGAPFSTTGQKAIVPKANTPESTGIALTAARALTATVTTTALTAGKATLFVYYVLGA